MLDVQVGGIVKCWGYNGNGELGYGDNINRGDNVGEMGVSRAPLLPAREREVLRGASGLWGGGTRILMFSFSPDQSPRGGARRDGSGDHSGNVPHVRAACGKWRNTFKGCLQKSISLSPLR